MNKPIKFYAIGDPHISKRHLSLSQEAISGTIRLLEKRTDVDLVVIMGDILDRHDDAKLTFQRMAIDWVNQLVSIAEREAQKKDGKNIVIVVLIGNHDRPNNQDVFSEIHPFMGMQDIPKRLYIVNKPKAVSINGSLILFTPYVPPGKLESSFGEYLKLMHASGKWKQISSMRDFALIFSHQEYKDAPYGPIISVKGDEWPENYPMNISGHIHTRLLLKPNLLYTGSLYPITTSESNDKGVISGEYNPSTKKLDYRTIRVVTSQKVVMKLSATNEDDVREMIHLDRENTKYIIQGTAEELASVKKRIQDAKSLHPINVSFDLRIPDPSTIRKGKMQSYDEIVRSKATTTSVRNLLEEIIS